MSLTGNTSAIDKTYHSTNSCNGLNSVLLSCENMSNITNIKSNMFLTLPWRDAVSWLFQNKSFRIKLFLYSAPSGQSAEDKKNSKNMCRLL